jgi:DNA (cytosine-5)-methyltransferase 1
LLVDLAASVEILFYPRGKSGRSAIMGRTKGLRAIDLYSGVGGWSCGLQMAGISVVASYEKWGAANETNFKNNLHQAQTCDIRRLSFDDLPRDIDIVVGSPPCTEFSFSNRGGNGDIEDGLQDFFQFLTVVDHIKPKAWAMENVPRVAGILLHELAPGGSLHYFSHLGTRLHVVNMEDFGIPQRRKRCIAGNFNLDLLLSYADRTRRRTLGDVVSALSHDPVTDPLFGIKLPGAQLLDHVPEAGLNLEEERINRTNKTMHIVYNAMPFPDPLDRAVRTITATCTRVSRESIVIEAPEEPGSYRRLTIRERACLQGFPITYQFYGATYGQKLRMIGNAIPPAFTCLLGHAFRGTSAGRLPALGSTLVDKRLPVPPLATPPDRPGGVYPATRRFRFAIPSLRLKSGVRFELRNTFDQIDAKAAWRMDFYFGTSTTILTIRLDETLQVLLETAMPREVANLLKRPLHRLRSFIRQADVTNMQRVWSHKGVGGTQPFALLDAIDMAGKGVSRGLANRSAASKEIVRAALDREFAATLERLPGTAKLERNAHVIGAGLIIGPIVNRELEHRLAGMTRSRKMRKAG